MNTAVFVPKPSLPPPTSEVGVVGWLRKNLFSSLGNSVLTFIALYFLYLVIPPIINWVLIDATFLGSDRTACETTNASGDTVDAPGACWTFINIRLEQILFGLHFSANPGEIWRPLTMFFFVFIIIFSLLHEKTPHKPAIAAFTVVIFPFICFALIEGSWLGLPVVHTSHWGGFMLTFMLASVGIVAALPIGILLALGRRSNLPFIKTICIIFIESIRGVPLITLLFMGSNMLPLFFPPGVEFDKVVRAMVAITLFQSAYTAEAIRGGLQAIGQGQYEAADALGLGYWRKTIFIILPQALKISIPGIVNTFIQLLKDTTLVSIIGLHDLLGISQAASRSQEWAGYDFEGYVFAAVLFFMGCFGLSRYSVSLENKLHTEHKKKR